MDKLITAREEGATRRFFVWDQEWTPEALEELRRDHGILFREDSVVPVMIRGKILVLGIEDDGVLSFGPDAPRFHVRWAPALTDELEEAVRLLQPPAENGEDPN